MSNSTPGNTSRPLISGRVLYLAAPHLHKLGRQNSPDERDRRSAKNRLIIRILFQPRFSTAIGSRIHQARFLLQEDPSRRLRLSSREKSPGQARTLHGRTPGQAQLIARKKNRDQASTLHESTPGPARRLLKQTHPRLSPERNSTALTREIFPSRLGFYPEKPPGFHTTTNSRFLLRLSAREKRQYQLQPDSLARELTRIQPRTRSSHSISIHLKGQLFVSPIIHPQTQTRTNIGPSEPKIQESNRTI